MYDHVVVGGGIVGISTAWNLLRERPGAGLLLLEKESGLGRHQTGHNSGVVHSGIYYEPGSLKARLCRSGAARTRELAEEHGIPFRTTGKLLVATDERELSRMDALLERAGANGIKAEVLDGAELRRREPMVNGLGALFIAETGVVDYREVTRFLAGSVRSAGGELRTGVEVTGVAETGDAVRLETSQGPVWTRHAVFCGGLQADRLAALAGLELDLRIVPFRGEYFDVAAAKRGLVSSLIYPIPDPALPFLGVHLTTTVTGELNVGPNAVLGLAREKYAKGSFDRRDAADIVRFRACGRSPAGTGAPAYGRCATRSGSAGTCASARSTAPRSRRTTCSPGKRGSAPRRCCGTARWCTTSCCAALLAPCTC